MMRYAYRVFFIGLFGIMGSLHGEEKSALMYANTYIQNQTDHMVQIKYNYTTTTVPNWGKITPGYIQSENVVTGNTNTYTILIDGNVTAKIRCVFDQEAGVHDVFITDKTGTAKNDNGYVGGRDNPVCLHYPDFKIKVEPHLYDVFISTWALRNKFSIYIQDESAGC